MRDQSDQFDTPFTLRLQDRPGLLAVNVECDDNLMVTRDIMLT